MLRLRLKVLGGFEARIGPGEPLDIATRKTRALLAYLALPPGRVHARDKLTGLLWSDRGDEQARNSLRQALTELGRILAGIEPSPLVKGRDNLSLDREGVEVDAMLFERLAASPDAGDLRRAAAMYAGDLLDGFGVRDPAFEEWLRDERQRYRELAIATLKKLVTCQTGANALAVAQRLLAMAPLQEEVHRTVMRLHAEAGDIAAALRQYGTCCATLKRELDITPSPETEALHRRIRDQATARPDSDYIAASAEDLHQPPMTGRSKPSIAVLPFRNLSGDPEQQYFSDGITEDIITELSRFPELFVIARHSSFQFRNEAVDVKEVGRDLGVEYVVEGNARRSADRVRITARLIEAETGGQLWSERYDRDLADLFDLQDEVARMIASALAVRLELEDLTKAKRKPPESMRAYDYWLRGKKCLDLWTPDANAEARRLFAKAIESDPEYARGYAGLAFTYAWGTYYSAWDADSKSSSESARLYAERAVALDDTDHLPHVTLGWVHHERGAFEQAQMHFARATSINPNDADTIMNKAMVWALEGKSEAALEMAQFAIRLNPRHPDWYFAYLGGCYYRAHRYEDAAATWERAPDAVPEVRATLAAAYIMIGRPNEAHRHMEEFLRRFSQHWAGQPSIKTFVATVFSFREPDDLQRFGDALRRAGMPD
jgi:TolB-like protein/Tfp pilus assembly protein PilF